jgi:signal peptidase I
MKHKAPRRARRIYTNKKAEPKCLSKEIGEWVLSIIIAVALALVVHNYVGQIIGVDGPSMEPTLFTGEHMLVTKYTYHFKQPERGEIIIVHFPDERANYVKRLIGLPGDTISARNNHLYVNGVELDEPYLYENVVIGNMEEITVPEGCIYVMGDNRGNSRDSRSSSVGPLPYANIVGKVQAVAFPLNRAKWLSHCEGTLGLIGAQEASAAEQPAG